MDTAKLVMKTRLPVRIRNSLVAGGYLTLGHVSVAPDAELLMVPGIGPTVLKKIRKTAPFRPAASDLATRSVAALESMIRQVVRSELELRDARRDLPQRRV